MLVICVIVAVFWKTSLDERLTVIKPANLVSLQNSETGKKAQQKRAKKALKQVMLNHGKTTPLIGQSKKEADQDWSYLAVYRRLEWAGVCSQYYRFKGSNRSKNNTNYVDDLATKMEQTQPDKKMSPRAVSTLNSYQQRCDHLEKEVYAYLGVDAKKAAKSRLISVRQKLGELLADTTPKTAKEITLKRYNDVAMDFGKAYAYFESTKKQHELLNKDEREALRLELQGLYSESNDLGSSLDIEQDLLLSEQPSVRINAINHQLENRYDTGAEAYLAAKQNLLDQLIEIQANLITNDADAFKIMKLTAEMSWETDKIGIRPYFSMFKTLDLPLLTPGEQMMAAVGVKARNAFSHAANPATLLYLCSLGYDCGAEGSLAMLLCLNHWQNAPDACELTVDQFLIEHAVSPNLLEDVLTLYQWMEQAYGA